MNYHIVRYGDTIYKIAQMYNVSVNSICKANPRINPHTIAIGQIISIPQGPMEKQLSDTSYHAIKY